MAQALNLWLKKNSNTITITFILQETLSLLLN